MTRIIKYGLLLIVFLVVSWTGYAVYSYFFDITSPELRITGLQNGGYYFGDMHCIINTSKSGDLTVFLDGKTLIANFKLAKASKGYSLPIPTKTLSNGKHHLKIEFTDRTYHKNGLKREYAFFVDNTPLQAAFVKQETPYKVFQGRVLHLQLQVNKEIDHATVTVLSQTYTFFPESKNSSVYECFVPIACEEIPNEYLLTVEVVDRAGLSVVLENKFQVMLYPFKKQQLHVNQATVSEIEQEENPESGALEDMIVALTAQSPREKLWKGSFCTPLDISRVTCEFGTVRTTQKKGRYMHKALDVINMPRCVVWATQDGVVVLKERYPMSGNTVIIDHGWGLLSLFFHLEDFADISVGQKIAQGNPIGTMGKTGYASGYHLHWEMRLNNIAIDPMQWTRASF